MSRTHVGILRGGPSSEYEVSLTTGATVLQHLPQDKYTFLDIYIDQEGKWHVQGQAVEPHQALQRVDVVFNALHGEYGEDGKVQRILEKHGVPFTGSNSFGSALAMNKVLSKKTFAQHGLKTPHYKTLRQNEAADQAILDIFRSFPMPAVVKPVSQGSSVGVSIAKNIAELREGIAHAFEYDDSILIEEFIKGIEASCGVLESFRGQKLHALIPIEIRPKASHFFDYTSKYTDGGSDEICPGNFTLEEKARIEEYAKRAHEILGLRHYSRSDFIVTPRRGIYILETNTLPGLTPNSLLPKELKAGGTELSHFLDHIIELALGKK